MHNHTIHQIDQHPELSVLYVMECNGVEVDRKEFKKSDLLDHPVNPTTLQYEENNLVQDWLAGVLAKHMEETPEET